MDNEGAAFKPETIGKVLAMHFTDPKTKGDRVACGAGSGMG